MKQLKWLLCVSLLTLLQLSARADVALTFGNFSTRNDSQTTFGWSFTLASPLQVTDLGYFDLFSDGLTDAHQVAIWTSAGGAPLISATIPAGTGASLLNGVRYVAISPFTLPAGTYTIGGFSQTNSDAVAAEDSSISTAPGITYNGARSAQARH
jgi:hypothetical protein